MGGGWDPGMSCSGCQFLNLHRPKKATTGPGEQRSAQRRDLPRGRGDGRERRLVHAQRDPSVPRAEGGVQGWDTRAALLLIGRRWAERGGAGAGRAARGLAGVLTAVRRAEGGEPRGPSRCLWPTRSQRLVFLSEGFCCLLSSPRKSSSLPGLRWTDKPCALLGEPRQSLRHDRPASVGGPWESEEHAQSR